VPTRKCQDQSIQYATVVDRPPRWNWPVPRGGVAAVRAGPVRSGPARSGPVRSGQRAIGQRSRGPSSDRLCIDLTATPPYRQTQLNERYWRPANFVNYSSVDRKSRCFRYAGS